jgi:vacuolar-type H+-ATPase subunit E/Vma4
MAKAEAEANADAKKQLTAADEDAKKLKDLMLSDKNIETRDRKLAAKQQTISNALNEAKNRLTKMDAAAYGDFVWKYLSGVNLSSGETLRIAKAYVGSFDLAALNGKLKGAGKPELKLDTAYADNGFKLIKADAENDFSFDALIDYYRVDLERTVVERVFQ